MTTNGSSTPLGRLSQLGQSVWVDFISREALQNGEIARLVREDAVVGLTSNNVLRYNGTTGAFLDTFVPMGAGLNGPSGIAFLRRQAVTSVTVANIALSLAETDRLTALADQVDRRLMVCHTQRYWARPIEARWRHPTPAASPCSSRASSTPATAARRSPTPSSRSGPRTTAAPTIRRAPSSGTGPGS